MTFKTFLRLMLSESDDKQSPSLSRVLTLFLALVCAGVLVYLVIKNHQLPSDIIPLAAFFSSPYLINRGTGSLTDAAALFKK